MQLGSTLRRFRLASGLSQAELARRVKVSASFLSRVEHDQREPTLTVLRRFAEHLNVPFGVLLAAALGEVSADPKWQTAMGKLIEAVRTQLLTEAVEQPSLFRGDATEPGPAR
jgi:transcriptional regulator with XRE-family HTH domain